MSATSKRFAVCPGSLVPVHWHNADLLDLLSSRLNSTMINFVACKVVETVRCRPSHSYPTPPESPNTEAKKPVGGLPPLGSFIKAVVKKSRCHVPTLLASTVYLERLRARLPSTAQGCPTTRHRCALAAIIIAAKYLNDSSPMNKHWARYSEFSLAEINLMEMQLLAIFNFDLRFDEAELTYVLQPLLKAERVNVRNSLPPAANITVRDRRERTYSVDAAALALEETGEAGKQLTPAYQRTTGVARPRGPLPNPPPQVLPRPATSHQVSYPRHRRPGSTTPLSSPPPLSDSIFKDDLPSSSKSSYHRCTATSSSHSSSSTLSSASSSSFGPRTPFTPLTGIDSLSESRYPRSPIPPIPIPRLNLMIATIPPFSDAATRPTPLSCTSKKLSPELSAPDGADSAISSASSWLLHPVSVTTLAAETDDPASSDATRKLRRRDLRCGGHVTGRCDASALDHSPSLARPVLV